VPRLCSNDCARAQMTSHHITIPAGVVGQQGRGARSRNVSTPKSKSAKCVLAGV
jgi:hypothetical protein